MSPPSGTPDLESNEPLVDRSNPTDNTSVPESSQSPPPKSPEDAENQDVPQSSESPESQGDSEDQDIDESSESPESPEEEEGEDIDESSEPPESPEEEGEDVPESSEPSESPEDAEGEDIDDDLAKRLEQDQRKITFELDGHETIGRQAFQKGDYQHSFNEYKAGLRACSDLIISKHVKENPELLESYKIRRRKFCVNVALVCTKIFHFAQGLEACTLVLAEGPDDDMQRVKALYRSGLCAQGMGELGAAKQFFNKILEGAKTDGDDGEEGDGTKFHVAPSIIRDVKIQLRNVAKEKKQYKKFAREMCNPTKKKNIKSIILPEKKAPTEKELEQMAEVEERRREYVERKRRDAEYEERSRKEREKGADERPKPVLRTPDIPMSEEDCISALDELAERYADAEVQKALREASFDHGQFSKGYIVRSKKILAPIQKDVFEKYGFLNTGDSDDVASIANTDAHDEALRKFQQSVRYLSQSNDDIAERADLCQELAIGNILLGDE